MLYVASIKSATPTLIPLKKAYFPRHIVFNVTALGDAQMCKVQFLRFGTTYIITHWIHKYQLFVQFAVFTEHWWYFQYYMHWIFSNWKIDFSGWDLSEDRKMNNSKMMVKSIYEDFSWIIIWFRIKKAIYSISNICILPVINIISRYMYYKLHTYIKSECPFFFVRTSSQVHTFQQIQRF